MSDPPPREKTKSETLLVRLESRVSKLTSRIKALEIELERTKGRLQEAINEVNAIKEKFLSNLARVIHGTEPPPAIKGPEKKDDD